MIRFALQCDGGHGFEGWFRDNASFEAQARRGLVTCPVCGSDKVEKAIMAPNVARSDLERTGPAQSDPAQAGGGDAAGPAAMVALSPEQKALREMLRALRQHVEANAENVGKGFAEEALKMHHGEIEHRSIYGQATPEEVATLKDEGVEAWPLPPLPDERN